MSVTTIAQVRALVKTPLPDIDLQPIIDREEAYLARELEAPIAGERTQTIWRLPFGQSFNDIFLRRPTDAVVVTDNAVVVDTSAIRLLEAGTVLERADGPWHGPIVTITYTPNDLLEVERVVVELVRLTTIETGFNGEDIGTYRYEHGRVPATAMQIQNASRKALVRTLLPRPHGGSARLQSGHLERTGIVVWPS